MLLYLIIGKDYNMKKFIILSLIIAYSYLSFSQYSLNKPEKVFIYSISVASSYYTISLHENDKYAHWFVSANLTALTMQYNKKLGILTVICLGLAKELYDSKTGGYFSIPDMQANLTGVLFGIAINIAQDDKRSNYFKLRL